jgi:hypothetical protein
LANVELKHPPIASLFVQSLNEVFDLQTTRLIVAVHRGIATPVWIVLAGITILVMLQVGYLVGCSRTVSWFAIVALSLAFSAVVVLIADLDRTGTGGTGLIKVRQQPMIDLQDRLNAP